MQKLPIFRYRWSADVQSPPVGKCAAKVVFLDEQVNASQWGGMGSP